MSLETLPAGQLRAFTFDPDDGTVYRAVFAILDETTSAATYVGPTGIFFAFGVGNRPVTGYFFSRRHPLDFGYFYEKMHGCADGYLTTVYMAWLTLLILLNRELPETLPRYNDEHELLEVWYQSLDTKWADNVRQLATP